ncbi:hypothetical protein ACKWTF_015737 [Chironomus riparius]
MNKIIWIIFLFFGHLWLTTKVTAQTAECNYKNGYHWATGYKTRNDSYYKCELDTRKADYDEKLTVIDGQHETGHSDANVKFIENYLNNRIKTFSSIFCKKFPNLEIIKINDAAIEAIDDDSLINCKNLDSLIIFSNIIREIPENLLIKNSKLTYIRIDSNQLTTLHKNIFQNQKELKEAWLNDNQLNFLPCNIFRSLVKLESLQLFNNELQSINPAWFSNLQSLKWLGLNGNQISVIPSKCFTSLKTLNNLWLYENKISVLNSDSFDGLQNLQLLNLHSTDISDLKVGVFNQLKNLQELYLQNNKLTTIHSDSFGVHKHLFKVNLDDNKIIGIDPKFINNTSISTLLMANNTCSQISTTTRSKIKQNIKKCLDNYQPRGRYQLQCGKPKSGRGNIIGGTKIESGDFPWTAALMTPKGKFFCGATLVSSRKVITAAHCIHQKKTFESLSASSLMVLLGAHDLDKYAEIGRVFYAVYSINIHPDWNALTQSYDADIAVLVLEKEVTFNEHIQSICLPSPNSNIATITTGSVVGYGKSEDDTKEYENIPKILSTPIHSNSDCFKAFEDLALLSSGRTFCGGSGRGVGVCNGDSGSGLIVTDGSSYYLRGVVSSSLLNANRGCDVNIYAIFTDILKYIDWINGIKIDRFSVRIKKND